jgi:hypothetical protein
VVLEWSGAVGALIGLGFFLMGLLQHNHAQGNKHKAREAFALTLVGTALLDLGLFALRFRTAAPPQPGSEQMVYLVWGFTGMMMLMTGFGALRPHRLRKFSERN